MLRFWGSFIVISIFSAQANALSCRMFFSLHSYHNHTFFTTHEQTIREKTKLKVVSWNLENFYVKEPRKGLVQDDPPETYNPSARVKEKDPRKVREAAKLIKELHGDIIILQEVVGRHSSKALDPDHEYHHFAEQSFQDGRGLMTSFMVHKSLEVNVEVWNPPIEDLQTYIRRGLPTLVIRAKGERAPILILTGVHLMSALGWKPVRFEIMKRGEMSLLKELEDLIVKEFGHTAFGMMGDFNIDQNSRALNPIRNNLRDLIMEGLSEEFQVSFPHNNRQKVVPNQLDMGFANEELFALHRYSYIYHFKKPDGSFKTYRDHTGEEFPYPVTPQQRAENPSDHMPFVSVFDMTRAP